MTDWNAIIETGFREREAQFAAIRKKRPAFRTAPAAWPKLSALQQTALSAWRDTSEDFGVLCFRVIAKRSGVDSKLVRRTVRALARKGIAEFFNGCCDDDGQFTGSGYGLTTMGRDMMHDRMEKDGWKW